MRYIVDRIPLVNLVLDPQNPRFVNIPNADEESIKNYLVEYENVINIVKGINEEEGLMPGERIIVCKENDKYIVLEGNRRICSCKLLSGLLTTEKRIPSPSATTLENISIIDVDIVPSRASIQSTLYRRHIEGIKTWPTQAKQYFFARNFEKGESILNISKNTNSSQTVVRESIQKHNLLNYTLDLSIWNKDERDSIDRVTLKPDRFFRIFSSLSTTYNKNAKQLLHMEYAEKTLSPVSKLDKSIFNQGLHILARAAFITNQLSTRNHVEDVPEFVAYLEQVESMINSSATADQTNKKDNKDKDSSNSDTNNTEKSNGNDAASSETDSQNPSNDETTGKGDKTENNGKDSTSNSASNSGGKAGNQDQPKIPLFFATLKWNALNPSDPRDYGLAHLASEIQRLSESIPNRKETFYERFPFSATVILRSLLEQSLKFYIRKMNKWDDLLDHIKNKNPKGKNHIDPSLSQIMSYIRSNKNNELLFVEKKYWSAYFNATEDKNINYMDTVVHSTEMITPTKDKLDSIAKSGMFQLIYYVLNEKKHWPTT